MLLFGDFETTGLDPDADAPLEFGALLVTDALEIVDERQYLFKYPREVVAELRAAGTFPAHEDSGLWTELLEVADGRAEGAGKLICEPADFDGRLLAWGAHYFKGERPELAGFGPHFDQRYLRRYAPAFLGALSYRLRDVRTLANEVAHKYPTDWGPKPCGNHRALTDCRAALEYLRWFRLHVMMPYGCRPVTPKGERGAPA